MFSNFELRESILEALASKGITSPTPIQEATLEHALAGKDILGLARTGTGKTLAFGLPIAQALEPNATKGRNPRALILAPTRELALQVAAELEWLAQGLKVVTVYGGTGYGKQAADLKRGADIVVATPGRALDYLKQGVLNLADVHIAVLDEADEMLNAGFEEDVETLLQATPEGRQTLLFSATLPGWAKRLTKQHLREPVHADVVSDESVSYDEMAIDAPLRARFAILSDVLHAYGQGHAIVFTRTKAEVDELAKALTGEGHAAEAVHGDLNQVQRERVLERFRSGQVTVLVATDVAARGLDIPEVDLVVHYRLPDQFERYQHRSGRTGRAGRSGNVVLFYAGREKRDLLGLERAIGRKISRIPAPTPQMVQEAKLAGLGRNLEKQSNEEKDVWRKVAETWISNQDVENVAGLLAMTLGGTPGHRSLLTGEEGWLTVELQGRNLSVPQTVRILKGAGVSDLGKVQSGERQSYADMRPEDFKGLPTVLEGLTLGAASDVQAAWQPPSRKSADSYAGRQRSRNRSSRATRNSR